MVKEKEPQAKEAESGEISADLPPNRLQPVRIDPKMIAEWVSRDGIEPELPAAAPDTSVSLKEKPAIPAKTQGSPDKPRIDPPKPPKAEESPDAASPWAAKERVDAALLPSSHAPQASREGAEAAGEGENQAEVRKLRWLLVLAIGVAILALGTAIAALIVRTTPEGTSPAPAENTRRPAPNIEPAPGISAEPSATSTSSALEEREAAPDTSPQKPAPRAMPTPPSAPAPPKPIPKSAPTAAPPSTQPAVTAPKAKTPSTPQEGEAVF